MRITLYDTSQENKMGNIGFKKICKGNYWRKDRGTCTCETWDEHKRKAYGWKSKKQIEKQYIDHHQFKLNL